MRQTAYFNIRYYLIPILILCVVLSTFLAVRLDIPYFRQITSIVFLGFLPGWLIIQFFKLDYLDTPSKFVLSVGLSLAFLIFFCLIVNQLSLYFGYLHPLNEDVLTTTLSLALIIMVVIYSLIGKWPKLSWPKIRLSALDFVIIVFSITLPLLSIAGTILMNFSENNVLLMFVLLFIAILFVIVVAMGKQLSSSIYPFILLMIGLSLTLMFGLRSNHIVGVDTHHEYLLMQITARAQHWQIFEKSNLDSCLSITLLPTIYNVFLGINPEYLFKVFYPVLFSISPLVLYVIYKKYVGHLYGFIGASFFMSFMNFQETARHARTNTAILFVALAIMVLFHKKMMPITRRALFMLFLATTIVSHYSTTYVFFFILLIAFICSTIYKFILQENPSRKRFRITGVSIILFFTLIFIWYSQVIEVPFNSGIWFISKTIQSLQDLFVLESRNTVPAAFGVGLAQKQLPHHIEFVFNWLTIILMLIGVFACCLKESLMRKLKSVKNLDKDYLFLSISSVSILVIAVLFPMISVGYAIDRIYIQMLVIVSLFIVIGTISIIKFLNIKINPKWVLLLILIPYFWGQTSFTYQIMGAPRSMVLSTQNNQYDLYYVLDSESHACSWLKKYFADREGIIIYADFGGIDRLLSQAQLLPSQKGNLTAVENDQIQEGDYIYLRNYNIANNKLWYKRDFDYNEYKDKLINKSLVYYTATSAIYK